MVGTRRWAAFAVLCLGTLMVVLDQTIVNVALPSIRTSLGFSETSLAWVVNAYLLTYGGFLLLSGRLGDIYGQRRIFIAGIAVFTVSSVVCGLSTSQAMLVGARAVQGIGGALASAVGLSLVVRLFTDPLERAKAMGITGFVASGGGALGVVLGGVLTQALSWHWIFLVNVPFGIVVCCLIVRLVPDGRVEGAPRRLDVAGAVTVTGALLLAVNAVINGNQDGWGSVRTVGALVAAAVLFAAFIVIETRTRTPLIRLSLFRSRTVTSANIVGVLWAAAMFAWFFLAALYLQLVLGYDALHVGLAFLPGDVVMAICSVSVSAKLVLRFGNRPPMVVGLLVAGLGLLLLARAPEHGHFLVDVAPSMVLLGFGAGIAFNPVMLAAMGDVREDESGLASGLLNTSFTMGGALGLAALASVAAAKTDATASPHSLLGGYHAAFLCGAALAVLAAVVGAAGIRPPSIDADDVAFLDGADRDGASACPVTTSG
ncbi:MAG TPA: MFS transporter [Mycobacteriales bacterium]|nr:MFS transporter [Mycobacteriales bacterium]